MFENREQAGTVLAQRLQRDHIDDKDALVLGITRGGIVVALQVASYLYLSLDILVIKKIGLPSNPELAIGAVGPKKTIYLYLESLKLLSLQKKYVRKLADRKLQELAEQEKLFRGGKRRKSIKNKTVILVDDGIATGATVICAQKYLKNQQAKQIILAIPVISKSSFIIMQQLFDQVIALDVVDNFHAVGQFYREFQQVSNEQVIKIVASSH